jgi:isoaspartyl peptidase/L-asparaginase-like protein (Ntn-hydrolase superfamily)
MKTRRNFLKVAGGAVFTSSLNTQKLFSNVFNNESNLTTTSYPIVISTWKHGLAANERAYQLLKSGGKSIDAVEEGVKVSEADPNVKSVGYGGLPDRDGFVTLDACIMDSNGNCGSVAFVQNFIHPISIARLVMEKTPHIMLVGKGAEKFAIQNGFKKQNLLTIEAKKEWQKWLKESNYKPDLDNHDTIALLAIDKQGNLAGACTTSGLSWKYHGRIGDSPIIGAGLYVDNEVGAAGATGKGEAVMKICGTFLIVELMRLGKSPQEACEIAINRVVRKNPDYKEFQVGFIALNKVGEVGAFSLQDGFEYAVFSNETNKLQKSDFYFKL